MQRPILPVITLALSFILGGPASSLASANIACEQKKQAIQRQLDIARQYNNHGKIRGLERALANVETWCSDGGLVDKAHGRVDDMNLKVRERERELADAIAAKKSADKIAKRERKLEEAKAERREAVKERDALLEAIGNTEE